MRDPDHPSDWCLVSYALLADGVSVDPTKLEVVSESSGGLPACLDCLERAPAADGCVFWGGLRVNAIDTRGTTSCERPKLLFFTCIRPSVPTKVRTRGLLHTGAVAEVLQGAHCAFEVEDPRNELDAALLAKKLLAATGAHKPNAYDFGGGLVVHQEYYAGA